MAVPIPLEVEVDAARFWIAQGATILDVRDATERIHMRIPGSVWIPVSELAVRWGELPPERALLVQCSAGSRSFRASQFLRGRGLPAIAMVGGISAWLATGGATESGPL
jgi:rhodanese-related sulfurtransferase